MSEVYLTKIVDVTALAGDVFSVTFVCEGLATEARAGQFVHVKCDASLLLRRPISICDVVDDTVRIVFEARGAGTRLLSKRSRGEELDVLGPLGNGFALPKGRVIVVGGGVGTPPMLYAARSAKCGAIAILGYRDSGRIVLRDEFESVCDETIIATDDGSFGVHGPVTKPLEELLISGGSAAVLSCGPLGMQKAVAELCKRYGVPCQVSLEERMGCGVGACLVCACHTRIDGVEDMSRVCADGPVFDAECMKWT